MATADNGRLPPAFRAALVPGGFGDDMIVRRLENGALTITPVREGRECADDILVLDPDQVKELASRLHMTVEGANKLVADRIIENMHNAGQWTGALPPWVYSFGGFFIGLATAAIAFG